MVLVRESESGDGDLDLGFQLPSGQTRDVLLLFRAQDCVAPLKLRGTLTYTLLVNFFLFFFYSLLIHFLKDSVGNSTPDKLDLWLRFPLTSLISDRSPSQEEFSDLLSGGDLCHKQSITISIPFSQVGYTFF